MQNEPKGILSERKGILSEKKVFWANEKVFWANEKVFCANEKVSWANEKVFLSEPKGVSSKSCCIVYAFVLVWTQISWNCHTRMHLCLFGHRSAGNWHTCMYLCLFGHKSAEIVILCSVSVWFGMCVDLLGILLRGKRYSAGFPAVFGSLWQSLPALLEPCPHSITSEQHGCG